MTENETLCVIATKDECCMRDPPFPYYTITIFNKHSGNS